MSDKKTTDERLLNAISRVQDALILALDHLHTTPADRRYDEYERRLVLDRATEAIEMIRQATGEAG